MFDLASIEYLPMIAIAFFLIKGFISVLLNFVKNV